STGVCRPAAAHAVAYAESAQPGAFRCAVRLSGHKDTTKRGTRTRGARPIGPRPSRTRHPDELTGSPYSDLTRPPLREHDLRQALVTPGGVWTDVRVLTVTESTNADVASAAQAGAPDGLVVIAENQTAGRGRLGRRWEAPPRSALTFSVLLRPGVPAARLGWITLLAGVAVAESVGRVAVVDAVLKWPNDLLVRSALAGGAEQVEQPGRAPSERAQPVSGGQGAEYGKCGGILAEALPDERVVVGIGLNVSQRADELPPVPAPAFPPTSLALAGAAMTDRD